MWRAGALALLVALITASVARGGVCSGLNLISEAEREALYIRVDTGVLDALADARIAAVEAYGRYIGGVVDLYHTDARLAASRLRRNSSSVTEWRDLDDARLHASGLREALLDAFRKMRRMLFDACEANARAVDDRILSLARDREAANRICDHAAKVFGQRYAHEKADMAAVEARGMCAYNGHYSIVRELSGLAVAARALDVSFNTLSRLHPLINAGVERMRASQWLFVRQVRNYVLCACAVALAESSLDGLLSATLILYNNGLLYRKAEHSSHYGPSVRDGLACAYSSLERAIPAVQNLDVVVSNADVEFGVLQAAQKTLSQKTTALVLHIHRTRAILLAAAWGNQPWDDWTAAARRMEALRQSSEVLLESAASSAVALAAARRVLKHRSILAAVRQRVCSLLRPYGDYYNGRLSATSPFCTEIAKRKRDHCGMYGASVEVDPRNTESFAIIVREDHVIQRRRVHRQLMAEARGNILLRSGDLASHKANKERLSNLLALSTTMYAMLLDELADAEDTLSVEWEMSGRVPLQSHGALRSVSSGSNVVTGSDNDRVGRPSGEVVAARSQSLGSNDPGPDLITQHVSIPLRFTTCTHSTTQCSLSEDESPLRRAVRHYDVLATGLAAQTTRIYTHVTALADAEVACADAAGSLAAWRQVLVRDNPEIYVREATQHAPEGTLL